jgi:acyl carrier protein
VVEPPQEQEPPAAPALASAPAEVSLERIAELFDGVIEGEPLGEVTGETDFFMIGGNSLGAVRLMRKVKQELGANVRLRDFLLIAKAANR